MRDWQGGISLGRKILNNDCKILNFLSLFPKGQIVKVNMIVNIAHNRIDQWYTTLYFELY